jgi:hypothetical protein
MGIVIVAPFAILMLYYSHYKVSLHTLLKFYSSILLLAGSASLRVQDHPQADSESISSAGSGQSGSGECANTCNNH